MWAYRDWVIKAFNENMPFDQFTIEQPRRRPAAATRRSISEIGSGFNRCNITTNEGGIIDEEYLVLYTRDRTETTSPGLARPDDRLRGLPRPQVRPGLAAASSTSWRRSSTTRRRARWTATSRTRRRSSSCRCRRTGERFDAGRDGARRPRGNGSMPARRPLAAEFDKWLATATADAVAASLPSHGLHLHAPLNEGRGETVAVHLDGEDAAGRR